jgi:polyisoprenoid-binding protein YceI
MNVSFKKIIVLLFSGLFTCYSNADWQLEQEHSSINFNSVKKEHVVENHFFNHFSASISEKGIVNLAIDLSSVDTKIGIRDQRMKEHLFNTNLFPQALFTAQLNVEDLENMDVESSRSINITGEIDLHGQRQKMVMKVLVTKLSPTKLLVTNQKSVIIKAQDFDLISGINKLQKLANLPSITHSVPVNFILIFTHQ